MDNVQPQSESGDEESPAQKQARLRRERREAKIKAGGSSRLEKITNVSGRQNLPGNPPTFIAAPVSLYCLGAQLRLIISKRHLL